MQFFERLYEFRKKSGMTQEGLASALGVSRQAVSKWETGESMPDTENLIRIADALGVSLDALAGRERIEEAAPIAEVKREKKIPRAIIILSFILVGAICFLAGALIFGGGKNDATPLLPDEIKTDGLKINYIDGYIDGKLVCNFTANVSVDGEVTLKCLADDVSSRSVKAVCSNGIYTSEITVKEWWHYDMLVFTVKDERGEKSTILAKDIVIEEDSLSYSQE